MAPIIEPIVRLLSVPLGNLIYAVVLAISTFAAWLSCIYAQGKRKSSTGTRMQIGLLFLFLVQLVLLIITWLAWVGAISSHAYLPALDRSLGLFSLVILLWLWTIPKPSRVLDALVALLEVIVLLVGATGIILWLREATTSI